MRFRYIAIRRWAITGTLTNGKYKTKRKHYEVLVMWFGIFRLYWIKLPI